MRDTSSRSARPSIVYVVTSSLAVRFLRGQLGYLREAGFDVTVISSPGQELDKIAAQEGVKTFPIQMAREISPLRDLVSFWRLWRVLRLIRPHITNVGTPKAGLLGGLAAYLAGVPCRVYTLHGLRLETLIGFRRQMLVYSERLACFCANRVFCVSESLRMKAVSLGLVALGHTAVFGQGSCNGVEAQEFVVSFGGQNRGAELREKLGIPANAPVVGFVGRFTRDKGISELIEAFVSLRSQFSNLCLLLVGDFEVGDPPSEIATHTIKTDLNIYCTGFVPDAGPYYHVMDVLALPTHREGFPTVVLEAQASGKPVVATDATGAIDSIVEGVTGHTVPVGDSGALANALSTLLENPALAKKMGQAGQRRVAREFQPEKIWSELLIQYQSLLEAKGLPLPVALHTNSKGMRSAEIGYV